MTAETPLRSGAPLSLTGVTKHYGKTIALQAIDLDIPGGALVAITGPSGSGKSTLLHLVGAMDAADSGTIRVGETEVSSLRGQAAAEYRRSVGFVFQRFHLLAALSARDNVVAPVLPYRTDFDRHARADELLKAVGLADRADALPSELSGGEQQRVAIARALINTPQLLLADEPTGNLDSATGDEIMNLLLDLRARSATTILIATHDASVAARCERVVRLRDGAIIDDLTVPRPTESSGLLARIGGLDA